MSAPESTTPRLAADTLVWQQLFWPQPLLVSRVVSDFTVGVRDNGVCLLLRRLCCVPVMSRD